MYNNIAKNANNNTDLALNCFVNVAHPLPLRKGNQGRKVEATHSRVGLLQKMVTQHNVNVSVADWPLPHPHLMLDLAQHLDIGTGPPSTKVVKKSILRPPVVGLLGKPHIVLELR